MTISEIAKLAGVSSAAVSRYMNNGSLSEEKKERIARVIQETGYVPFASARTLRTGKSKQIGVIVPKLNSESVPRIVSGISSVLNEEKYQFFLADAFGDYKKEIEYLQAFENSQLDGVILLATIVTPKLRQLLNNMKLPVVVIGQEIPKQACVFHDDASAAYDMTRQLIAAGCKNLGYIRVSQRDRAAGALRTQGFSRALKEAGMALTDVMVEETDFSMEAGEKAMAKLLQTYPKVDGVFCATDHIAIGAMQECKKQGIEIPEQLKICGIGYSQMADIISPKLTTARYCYRTSGEEGARMLLTMLNNKEMLPPKQIMLGYEVILQESV